tara:strand:- start:34 stop:462 length:429 start_codon:yes stop_codon:yes gene_type:complete
MWALGCVIYEFLHGLPPFYSTEGETVKKINDPGTPQLLEFSDSETKGLILALLNHDNRTRITAEDIVSGRARASSSDRERINFFSVVDWKRMEKYDYNVPFNPMGEGTTASDYRRGIEKERTELNKGHSLGDDLNLNPVSAF